MFYFVYRMYLKKKKKEETLAHTHFPLSRGRERTFSENRVGNDDLKSVSHEYFPQEVHVDLQPHPSFFAQIESIFIVTCIIRMRQKHVIYLIDNCYLINSLVLKHVDSNDPLF